jgi:superfamily II DNA or RNA helicase
MDDITGGLKSCQVFNKLTLRAHQKRVSSFMMRARNRGILGMHSTGSGKSISALTVARCLKLKTILVLPTAVISGFRNEIERTPEFKRMGANLELTTYGMFLNDFMDNPRWVQNKLVILDEVHNFRSAGQETYKMIYAMSQAKKVLLLSATPLQNEPLDIVAPLCMLDENSRIGSVATAANYYRQKKKEFLEALEKFECSDDSENLKNIIRARVSFFQAKTTKEDENPNYPRVYMSWKKINMTPSYYKQYKKIENNEKKGLPKQFQENQDLSAFFNGLRRASNHIENNSPKLKAIIALSLELVRRKRKLVIYDAFQESGIRLIKKELDKKKIPLGVISGRESITKKGEAITKFNNDHISVLLITSAAAAGVNLIGTRDMIIVSPHWNESLIHQVISRGVRFRSHTHLPESKRSVRIHRFILRKPESIRKRKNLTKKEKQSIDELVLSYANAKEEKMNDFYRILAKCSIEKGC